MQPNPLRTIWAQGSYVVNGWCAIPSSWSAELMARAGWDSVTLDLQHGLLDYAHALPMLQAINLAGAVPMARAPWNEPGIIMKLLDAGALGIVCPMINTRDECERFVGACRYAPRGYRSFGPTRARVTYGSNYEQAAADDVLTFAMVETAEALANVEAIVSVPGLTGVYVGPADLSLSMGSPERSDPTRREVVAALDTIVAACQKHNVIAGIHCGSTDYALKMVAKGFRLVTISSDGNLLAAAASAAVKALRGGRASERQTGGIY
ncbi:MAG: aldolase/citrate lyase family protein [Anaerolineae bacterium]|nr:aldolase/citrate lyase family protein [Candidatus Roseilinea sp.]MDW8451752.1 aldolase/citrate lyase family protein [Anaerolineae bacterium]